MKERVFVERILNPIDKEKIFSLLNRFFSSRNNTTITALEREKFLLEQCTGY